jgi:prepilin-type N-terminal cleavage/methylation domain-containing protein
MATMHSRWTPRGCGVAPIQPSCLWHRTAVATAHSRQAGYTLIEVIGTLLVLALLTSLAISTFAGYAKRARAADALEQLDLFHTRMEKAFLDNGNYGVGNCAVPLPTGVQQFGFTCTMAPDAQSYTAKATGLVSMTGYVFQIDEKSIRSTQAFPDATVPTNCWMVERNRCQ